MRLETIPITPQQGNSDEPIWSALGWTQVTLIKESSGDVVFGTSPNLFPLTQGAGTQIPSGVPVTFLVPGGTRLYVAGSGPSERISLVVTRLTFLDLLEGFLLGQAGKR